VVSAPNPVVPVVPEPDVSDVIEAIEVALVVDTPPVVVVVELVPPMPTVPVVASPVVGAPPAPVSASFELSSEPHAPRTRATISDARPLTAQRGELARDFDFINDSSGFLEHTPTAAYVRGTQP
jgi:hypothetical protein